MYECFFYLDRREVVIEEKRVEEGKRDVVVGDEEATGIDWAKRHMRRKRNL